MSLCGTDEQLNIELLSQWELEAEFRKIKGINTTHPTLGKGAEFHSVSAFGHTTL